MSWIPDFGGDAGGSLGDVLGGAADSALTDALGGIGGSGFSGGDVASALGDATGGGPLSALAQIFGVGSQPVAHVQADGGGDYGGGVAVGPSQQASAPAADASAGATAGSGKGFLQKVMQGLGLSKDGTMAGVDLSDPKQLQAWMRLIMGGSGVLESLLHRKATGYQSTNDMLSAQGGGAQGMGWNPAQAASANAFFNAPAVPWNQRPVAYATGNKPGLVVSHYAHGGLAHNGHIASPGALSAVSGGQDDVIDASLAPGEYIMDADTVSAAGDGDNAAGARKLDEFRRSLREHKRSAPPDRIPPKAKPLQQYMPKGGR